MSITVYSILLGFLFTITTLLHTISNEKIEFIKKSGGINSIYYSLKASIYYSFFAVFIAIFYLLLESFLCEFTIVQYSLIFIIFSAASVCFNFIKDFFRIIM